MADSNVTQICEAKTRRVGAEAPSAPTPSGTEKICDVDRLQDTVQSMDALSKEGFRHVSSLTQLCMTALASVTAYNGPLGPVGASRVREVLHGLRAIRETADSYIDTIEGEAESVGCNQKGIEEVSHV